MCRLEKLCFWEIFYQEVAFEILHFTRTVYLYCVLLIGLINMADTWQIHDIAGFSFSYKSKITHKWLTIFNVLPYLTSLLLRACEGAALSVHYMKIYTEWDYMPLVLLFSAWSLFVFSFKPRPLYPGSHWKVNSMSSIYYWYALVKKKSLPGIEARHFRFTTCTLFTILTVLSGSHC